MTATPVYNALVSEYEFNPLAEATEVLDATPESAVTGGSDVADPSDAN